MKNYQKLVEALEDLLYAVENKTLMAEEIQNAEEVLEKAKESLNNVHLHIKSFGVYTAPTEGLFQIDGVWTPSVFYIANRPIDVDDKEPILLFGRTKEDFEKSFNKINIPK